MRKVLSSPHPLYHLSFVDFLRTVTLTGNASLDFGLYSSHNQGFPAGTVEKNASANAGDAGSVPGWGRSPRVGNGNPLQYSCLENSMDRGTWQVQSMEKSWTWLSMHVYNNDVKHLFMFFWPYACLLWRNVYLNLSPIIDWVVCFFDTELHQLFVYSGD